MSIFNGKVRQKSPFSEFRIQNSAFTILAFSLLLAFTGCNKQTTDVDDSLSPLWNVPQFNLTDQDGQPFGNAQVAGKAWIALLFFTECKGPCPMMAMRMQDIQDAVNNPEIKIVSFSVDPQNDTPEKINAYAKAVKAIPGRWYFLTGKPTDIQAAADGLKLGYEPPDKDGQIVHSTKCLLIDKKGVVRGAYSTEDTDSMNQLKLDAPKISKE